MNSTQMSLHRFSSRDGFLSIQLPKFFILKLLSVSACLVETDHQFIHGADAAFDDLTDHPVEPGIVGFGEGADAFAVGTTEAVKVVALLGFDIPF